jgi:hypothetical protein
MEIASTLENRMSFAGRLATLIFDVRRNKHVRFSA